MTDDEHTKAPTTIREVGIHIGYMREDMAEMKNAINTFTEHGATKAELEALGKRVKDIEDWREGLTSKVAGFAILLFVLMVLAWYGLDKLL
jgi:hypothetical protein